MEQDLTVYCNNKKYKLSEKCIEHFETIAENSFSENEYVDVHTREFDKNMYQNYPSCEAAKGEPVIIIETAGHVVPIDNIIQPTEESNTTFESIPEEKEDNDNYSIEHEYRERLNQPPSETEPSPYQKQIDQGRIPEMPRQEDEEPQMVVGVPEVEGTTWSTKKAIIPQEGFYFFNIQKRIDNPEYTETKNYQKRWEVLLKSMNCEVLETDVDKSDQEKRKPWDYSQKDGNNADSNAVGSRYHL